MAALDLSVVVHASTLHCSGGSFCAVSLNQSYLSHLKQINLKLIALDSEVLKNLFQAIDNTFNLAIFFLENH